MWVLVIICLIGIVIIDIALILKIVELRRRIDQLDPKHVSERFSAAIQELDQFKVTFSNDLVKAQEDLNTINERLVGLTESVRQTIREIIRGIAKTLKDKLGEDFLEEATGPEEGSLDKGTAAVESNQQTSGREQEAT